MFYEPEHSANKIGGKSGSYEEILRCDAVQVLNVEDTLRSWPFLICPPLGKSLLRLTLRNFCKRQLSIPSIVSTWPAP